MFFFAIFAAMPDRTYCMNNVLCLQIKSGRNNGRTGITVPDFISGILKLPVSCFFKNGATNTAASLKAFICGIYNRVCVQICN